MAKEIRKTALDVKDVNAHGRSFVGTVVSDKMAGTVVVAWKRRIYVPKFERYAVKTSKVKVHNPDSISAKEGDVVKIVQCRPISKTKNFIVVEKLSSGEDVVVDQSSQQTATKKETKESANTKKSEK